MVSIALGRCLLAHLLCLTPPVRGRGQLADPSLALVSQSILSCFLPTRTRLGPEPLGPREGPAASSPVLASDHWADVSSLCQANRAGQGTP